MIVLNLKRLLYYICLKTSFSIYERKGWEKTTIRIDTVCTDTVVDRSLIFL